MQKQFIVHSDPRKKNWICISLTYDKMKEDQQWLGFIKSTNLTKNHCIKTKDLLSSFKFKNDINEKDPRPAALPDIGTMIVCEKVK